MGQPVTLTSAITGERFISSIRAISPVINANTHNIDLFVHVKRGQHWHDGATVYATVMVYTKGKRIIVPLHSIVFRPAGQVVYVVKKNIAYERVVETGYRGAAGIEITKGLKAGEVIAVEGAGFLSNKSPVRIIKESGSP